MYKRQQSVDGANMRFKEFNENGGAFGRTIKLIVEDHQYTVPRAVQAANKLLRKDKVAFMMGALGTPMNNAVMTDQLAMNVPNLFPLTAARSMFDPFDRLKFTSGSTYYDQIRTGIKYLVENNKFKKLSVSKNTSFNKTKMAGSFFGWLPLKKQLKISKLVSLMRFPCSDALSYCQLCEGKLDAVIQLSLIHI